MRTAAWVFLILVQSACDPIAPIPALPIFTEIAVGDRHSCAVSEAGEAFCWGDGADGQLGTGTARSERFPARVSGDVAFVSVVAGGGHTCGLTAEGEAYCWGANGRGQAGVVGPEAVLTPTPVETNVRFAALSAGARHTCGIDETGTAWCWGAGGDGRLGDGASQDRAAPAAVAGGETFAAISAGGRHTCALTTADIAWCWGANDLGQLGTGAAGDPSPAPAPVATGRTFVDIAAGQGHSCAVPPDGRVHCWGENAYGELGNATRHEAGLPAEPRPVPIFDTNVFATVSVGRGYTCGVRVNGEAMCWGLGSSGQLGDGRLSDSPLQRLVLPEPGRLFTFNRGPWAAIDAGGDGHVCALTMSGMALCWGRGDHGQLGSGDWLSMVPQRVRFAPRS